MLKQVRNKMKILLSVLFVTFLACNSYGSGPTLPKEYRVPTNQELSAEWRKGDPGAFATVNADFNGDGLVDGAFLIVDDSRKELVLMVSLINKDSSETWLKLQAMDYAALKYQGIALIKPSALTVYKGTGNDEEKQSMTLEFNSIKSFSSEGASSIFSWDASKRQFKQYWLTK
jgi:hypothetical protein